VSASRRKSEHRHRVTVVFSFGREAQGHNSPLQLPNIILSCSAGVAAKMVASTGTASPFSATLARTSPRRRRRATTMASYFQSKTTTGLKLPPSWKIRILLLLLIVRGTRRIRRYASRRRYRSSHRRCGPLRRAEKQVCNSQLRVVGQSLFRRRRLLRDDYHFISL